MGGGRRMRSGVEDESTESNWTKKRKSASGKKTSPSGSLWEEVHCYACRAA
jgi:hypothetical protein